MLPWEPPSPCAVSRGCSLARAPRGNVRPPTVTDGQRDSASGLQGVSRAAPGKLTEAGPLLREALVGQRETIGPTHQDTLRTTNNLGNLLMKQGELAEAEPLLREAFGGQREKLGPTHPESLRSKDSLRRCLCAQGKDAETEAL